MFQVKLIDFGIAQRTVAAAGSGANVTMETAGGTSGTLEYMGALALGGSTDPRVDLWAMGVTLFQALTFQLPFKRGRAHLDPLPADKLDGVQPAALRRC